ncbi:MAG: uridine kinase [Bryobacterales bacterium]|nr:uridine kinase [Bryobacterales bacterium]
MTVNAERNLEGTITMSARSKPDADHPTRIIAIAGGSGAGKSFLAAHVSQRLAAPVLSLDAYYRDLSHLPLSERAQQNFDDPDALDWPLLRHQLALLQAGNPVEVPVYDFSTHVRTGESKSLTAREFLVIEGIFALWDAEVRNTLSAGVFLDFPDDGCLERRIVRDVVERGRTPASVRQQYEQTVRPMYVEYVAPTRQYADLCLPGDHPPELSLQALLGHLGQTL